MNVSPLQLVWFECAPPSCLQARPPVRKRRANHHVLLPAVPHQQHFEHRQEHVERRGAMMGGKQRCLLKHALGHVYGDETTRARGSAGFRVKGLGLRAEMWNVQRKRDISLGISSASAFLERKKDIPEGVKGKGKGSLDSTDCWHSGHDGPVSPTLKACCVWSAAPSGAARPPEPSSKSRAWPPSPRCGRGRSVG